MHSDVPILVNMNYSQSVSTLDVAKPHYLIPTSPTYTSSEPAKFTHQPSPHPQTTTARHYMHALLSPINTVVSFSAVYMCIH